MPFSRIHPSGIREIAKCEIPITENRHSTVCGFLKCFFFDIFLAKRSKKNSEFVCNSVLYLHYVEFSESDITSQICRNGLYKQPFTGIPSCDPPGKWARIEGGDHPCIGVQHWDTDNHDASVMSKSTDAS